MVHEADSLRGRKERSKRRSRPRGGAALEKFRPSLLGKGLSLDRCDHHRSAGDRSAGAGDGGGSERSGGMEDIDSNDDGGEAATPTTNKEDLALRDSCESPIVMAGGFGMAEGPFLTGGKDSDEDVSRMTTPAHTRPKPRAPAVSSAPAEPVPEELDERDTRDERRDERDESAESRPPSRPRSRPKSRSRSWSRSRSRAKKPPATAPPEGARVVGLI